MKNRMAEMLYARVYEVRSKRIEKWSSERFEACEDESMGCMVSTLSHGYMNQGTG